MQSSGRYFVVTVDCAKDCARGNVGSGNPSGASILLSSSWACSPTLTAQAVWAAMLELRMVLIMGRRKGQQHEKNWPIFGIRRSCPRLTRLQVGFTFGEPL